MDYQVQAEHVVGLHELVTREGDISTILRGVTRFASNAVGQTAGASLDCALTLRRRKRTATIAGSSDKAVLLDRLEQSLGEGPCIEALQVKRPVLLADATTDTRWPKYSQELAAQGCISALGVPMDLGETSEAVLNFFAPSPGTFTDDVIAVAAGFADVAGSVLRLAIRIESVERLNSDLKAAMASRKFIDTACGIVMAQSRCTTDEAFTLLQKASSNRGEKLHTVAAGIIAKFGGQPKAAAYFDD